MIDNNHIISMHKLKHEKHVRYLVGGCGRSPKRPMALGVTSDPSDWFALIGFLRTVRYRFITPIVIVVLEMWMRKSRYRCCLMLQDSGVIDIFKISLKKNIVCLSVCQSFCFLFVCRVCFLCFYAFVISVGFLTIGGQHWWASAPLAAGYIVIWHFGNK